MEHSIQRIATDFIMQIMKVLQEDGISILGSGAAVIGTI